MSIGTSIDGLVSGLDTTSLINQLIAAERAPQNRLVTARDRAQNVVKAYQALNKRLAAVRDAAGALADPAGWNVMKSSSSTPAVATATTSSSALGGSLTFSVDRLATSATVVSAGTVPSLTSVITSGPLLVSSGGEALGFATLGGTDLALGDHTIKVTQASSAATVTGSTAVAGSVVIDGTNQTLRVDVDGVMVDYTIAAGTYDPAGLADAVAAASGGTLAASIDGDGQLALATVDEGSAATVRVRNGGSTALAALGFTGTEVNTTFAGTDGVVEVDGTATTVTDVRAGATVVLPSGTGGSVTATLSGGLRLGTIDAENVDTGDGTLSAVVKAVNDANAGVTATAIQVADGQYKLQLASTESGLEGAVAIDTSSLGMGAFNTIGVAQDAQITVGTGPGAFTVTSSSNTVKELLPGVTINLLATGETTIDVTRDADALAAKVSKLVDAVNEALGDIQTLTAYDPDTGNSGILMGQFAVRQLQGSLVSSLTGAVSTSSLATAATAGVSITREGTFTFDKATFVAAYEEEPEEVAKLFQRGGVATSADVSLSSATHKTRAGAYAVEITQAASQATAVGADLSAQGNLITNAETIDIRVGGATGDTYTYSAVAGESLDDIATGLNTLLAADGQAIVASVQGNALVVNTTGYGASSKFEVRSSDTGAGQTGIAAAPGVYEAKAGTNVAGTIDGVVASGTGQLLHAATDDDPLFGLSLRITATADEVTAAGGTLALGDFTYVPGFAQLAAQAGANAVDVVSGTITNAIDGRRSQIADYEEQIEAWDRRLALRQATLRRQFSAMETALSSMRQQSEWLAGQVNQLASINNFRNG